MNQALLCLFYFLAGVLASYAWRYMRGRPRKEAKKKPQRWTSIERISWGFDFELPYVKEMTSNEIATAVAISMQRLVEKKPLPALSIDSGDYTVRIGVEAIFVKRESKSP